MEGVCEGIRRKGLAANCGAESRQVCAIGHIFRALPRWRETSLEELEDCDVFSRKTTIAGHAARLPFEDRVIDRVCRRKNDGRQCSGRWRENCLPIVNLGEKRNLKRRDFDLHRPS